MFKIHFNIQRYIFKQVITFVYEKNLLGVSGLGVEWLNRRNAALDLWTVRLDAKDDGDDLY